MTVPRPHSRAQGAPILQLAVGVGDGRLWAGSLRQVKGLAALPCPQRRLSREMQAALGLSGARSVPRCDCGAHPPPCPEWWVKSLCPHFAAGVIGWWGPSHSQLGGLRLDSPTNAHWAGAVGPRG